MPKTIKFEIVTPERTVLSEEIEQISVPSKEGEITVLPNHIPLIASLMPGVAEIVKKGGGREVISLSGGFIEVLKDKVVILADTAERAEELDEDRISQAQKRARQAIKEVRHFDQERFANISASLAKELARHKAVQRWKRVKNIK